jgi:Leucine rich repeat
VLILPNNRLSSLPPSFGSSFGGSLKSLSLVGNYLKLLPTSLFQSLTTVEHFDVRFNLLTNLNKVMLSWKSLTWLAITGNDFSKLPAWIAEFSNLHTLQHEWGLLYSYHACRHAQSAIEEDCAALDWDQSTVNMQRLKLCMKQATKESQIRQPDNIEPMVSFEDYLEALGRIRKLRLGSDPFYYGHSELPSLIQEAVKFGLTGFLRGIIHSKAELSRFNLEKIYQYSVMYCQNGILNMAVEYAKDRDIQLIQNHLGYGSFNPLFFALKDPKSDFAQFKFLVQLGADIHSVDTVGNNMIHALYQNLNTSGQKELQILELLLARG